MPDRGEEDDHIMYGPGQDPRPKMIQIAPGR